jgi:hypothetical protein
MIRLDTHDTKRPMTLPAACEWLGRHTGKVPATSTMWRWTLKGVRGGVRLESFRIGGTTYTTPEMIERFIVSTSQRAVAVNVLPAGVEVSTAGDLDRQDEQRREQVAAAHQRLKEICAPKRAARRSNTRR